jgi:putative transposase
MGCQDPGRGFRSKANTTTTAALVERRFDRSAPDQLWGTDITEHPTLGGEVHCRVVLDVFSRRVVGWAIDSHQGTRWSLTPSAWPSSTATRDRIRLLSIAITARSSLRGRSPSGPENPGCCPRWAPLATPMTTPSSNPSGPACRLNSSIASGGPTRLEFANAIFECLEIVHNRQRRHSALGGVTGPRLLVHPL